ncbi:MAG TPA: CpaF family protein, partial [Amnibacterium sp.]
MKLSERLAGRPSDVLLPEPEPVSASASVAPAAKPAPAPKPEPVLDALLTLKSRVGETLFERLGSRMNDPNLTESDLLTYAREVLAEIVEAERVPLSNEERSRLVREISDDVLGYGPLQPLLDDPSISEVMV